MADPQGVICHWSAGATEMFGYLAEEAVGRSLDLIVPEEYRERHWAGFRRTVKTGICKLDRATTNIPVRHKSGSVEAYPGRFVFLQGPRGEVVGILGIYARREGSEVAFGPVVDS